jgi:hypothetical protein
MAYNYYQPMGYTPMFQPQYQQMQGNPVQPQIQQPVQAQTQAAIIWVDGYNEAAMYPVAPNAAVALWDKSNPAIYLKRADATGKPSMQVFDLVERKESPKPEQHAETRFATVEALESVSNRVDGIIAQLAEERRKSHSTALNEGVEKDGC